MSTAKSNELLGPEFLAKLEQLELVSRKIFLGKLKGERRSKRKGSSVEFADYRNYVVGDDLRFIDWNILIRLDKLFLKLFEEEEDLHFNVLVDTSASMDFGDPTKLRYATQVAAALSFVGLVNQDRVRVFTFSEDLDDGMPAARGRRSLWRVLEYLGKIKPGKGSNLGQSCRTFSIRNRGRGIVVLISDLLDKNGFDAGLRYLVANQMDIFVIHVLAAEEVDPEIAGDLQLIDSEDGDHADITVSAPLLKRYKENVDAFCASVRDFCTRRGISYLFTTNQLPFEQLILTYLRQRGLVK